MNKSNTYLLYGIHAAISALKNNKRQIKQVFCTDQIFDKHSQIITKFSHKILTIDNINTILTKNAIHQGIFIEISPLNCYNMDSISDDINTKVAILDQLNDPHNIGAIIRSAVAFDIDTIIVSDDHSPAENAIIAKAACGGLEHIKIIRVTNINSCINNLKKKGFWIVGMDSNSNEYFTSEVIRGKIAIILGSEGKGLRRLTKENCDFLLKLPISHKSESLNVSNAAAIIFHEMFKIRA